MVALDSPDKVQKALDDITFRMNCMMAYDIYLYLSGKYELTNSQKDLTSVYKESHLLNPSYEISVVFGRQLLDFLQIGHNKESGQLGDPATNKNKSKPDDLFISSFPGISVLPVSDPVVKTHERQIKSIIKVANKASAHLTVSHTTGPEFLDVAEIKPIIHELCIKYVPNINVESLWWLNKDKIKNAHIEK